MLLVEDHPELGPGLKAGLEECHYAVDLVANGEDALALASLVPYDLLILDILLPELDGWEVCRRLREQRKTMSILFLTALVQLGPTAQRVAILAISVDPGGDTPTSATAFSRIHQLQGYQNWHYLLGTCQELTPIWASYDVIGVPPGASMMSQSAMNHSAVVYIIDQQRHERVPLNSDFTPTQLVEDIRLLQTSHAT